MQECKAQRWQKHKETKYKGPSHLIMYDKLKDIENGIISLKTELQNYKTQFEEVKRMSRDSQDEIEKMKESQFRETYEQPQKKVSESQNS